jgi:hypothetical protein
MKTHINKTNKSHLGTYIPKKNLFWIIGSEISWSNFVSLRGMRSNKGAPKQQFIYMDRRYRKIGKERHAHHKIDTMDERREQFLTL